MSKTLKIGTRGSPLALVQTHMVRDTLLAAHTDLDIEIVIMKTSGDWKPEDGEPRLNTTEGGKGQFAKELEEAMLAGKIDCAVHSMKDMESHLPGGLIIEHMMKREDPRDCLLLNNRELKMNTISDIPYGARVGTASVRRQAFLLSKRPDLKIEPFRGNVGTRIEKLRAGQVDVTLLAMAGLKRLGLADEIDVVLQPEEMLPAAGQGAVGVEMREDDEMVKALFDPLRCLPTTLCVTAERAALAVLDGSCHTPIGSHAILDGDDMHLRVCVVSLDGTQSFEDEMRMAVHDLAEAKLLGATLGTRLKSRLPEGILEQVA